MKKITSMMKNNQSRAMTLRERGCNTSKLAKPLENWIWKPRCHRPASCTCPQEEEEVGLDGDIDKNSEHGE